MASPTYIYSQSLPTPEQTPSAALTRTQAHPPTRPRDLATAAAPGRPAKQMLVPLLKGHLPRILPNSLACSRKGLGKGHSEQKWPELSAG